MASSPDTIVLWQAPVHNVELPQHDAKLLHEATSIHAAARHHTNHHKQLRTLFCCCLGTGNRQPGSTHADIFTSPVWLSNLDGSSVGDTHSLVCRLLVPGLQGEAVNRCSVRAATLS